MLNKQLDLAHSGVDGHVEVVEDDLAVAQAGITCPHEPLGNYPAFDPSCLAVRHVGLQPTHMQKVILNVEPSVVEQWCLSESLN